jgi:hypothetical protein
MNAKTEPEKDPIKHAIINILQGKGTNLKILWHLS